MMGPMSPPADSSWKAPAAGDVEARKQVRGLISAMLYGQDSSIERREQVRYAFPQPVYHPPVGPAGTTPAGEPMVAAGKNLSECGMGFYHPAPLPARRMIVSLQLGGGRWLAFLVEFDWTHAIRQGWYESGGRFLQAVPSPMEATPFAAAGGHSI